ncbi:MAG: phosphate ABC transporter permease subunit PstC [Myxococcota bacterium]|nr:phosphate ABC transporter permease subunit PstC [Myxococcota bacterium]MDW8363067.1 phosphate ABC transporter permease subunit PstC [Myxococcales bacterium]
MNETGDAAAAGAPDPAVPPRDHDESEAADVPRRKSRRLADSFRTPWTHRLVERAVAAVAWTAIVAIAFIFVFVAREAIPLLYERHEDGSFRLVDLFAPRQWPGYDAPVYVWQPVGTPEKFNVVPLFVGTLKVTVLAMLLSVPLGVGCAMYVSQYASRRVREIVKPVIELLASLPSVVLGFFALIVLASSMQAVFGFRFRLNATVAAVALSLAIVPVVFTVTEDALSSVPRSLHEAAIALGARKYQTTLRVVIPAALPGIAAAIILGFGRAIGETMIVLMASGNAATLAPFDPTTSVRTVTATIAAELGEVARGEPHWRVLFLLGLMLFALTFLLNLAGGLIVRRLHRRLTASAT